MAGFRTPGDPVDENENIRQLLAHFHQTEQARLSEAEAKLRVEIIPKLLRLRVANVEVAYSGCGDSGAIDGTQFAIQPASVSTERACRRTSSKSWRSASTIAGRLVSRRTTAAKAGCSAAGKKPLKTGAVIT